MAEEALTQWLTKCPSSAPAASEPENRRLRKHRLRLLMRAALCPSQHAAAALHKQTQTRRCLRPFALEAELSCRRVLYHCDAERECLTLSVREGGRGGALVL